ncbi:unnamed protein product, partial [Mesorhabditis belari]|uniref:Neurotransmitter-gated ion-channel ligand-binding domain-containing protein n=1 Tax=Mesorhabditis belari TaxID=2138241 RepID=A0AAF3EZI8_9BILA
MLKTKLFFTLLNLVNTSYLSQKLDVNYDKRLSPYYLNRNAVNVSLSIPYLLLIDVVEDAQLVSWLVTFTITWRDDRLKYNPAQNGGETKMFVPNTEVWTPRFIVYNSIEHRKLIEDEKNDVSISPVGQVKLQITQFINIICDIQVERMPFDTQFCSFRIVSPLQSQKYTFLQGHLEKQTAMFRGNSEFHLSNVSVSEYDYEMDEDEMHEIYFETELIRRPNYFIIVIVIPSFLISTMTITGILLPVHQGVGGDAITVGLASMLALSITLSIVAETLPRTSNIPLIGAYILACLIICSLAVIFGLLLTHFKVN